MTTLINELNTDQKTLERDFDKLARQIAAGDHPPRADARRVLDRLGLKPDDLQQAVERIQLRQRLRDEMPDQAALERELVDLPQKIAAADAKLMKAEAAHEQVVYPIRRRIERVHEEIRSIQGIKDRLERTASITLKNELDATVKRLGGLTTRRANLLQAADRKHEIKSHEQAAAGAATPQDAEVWLEYAKQARRVSAEAEAALPGVNKEIARLEAEEKRIRAKMLEP